MLIIYFNSTIRSLNSSINGDIIHSLRGFIIYVSNSNAYFRSQITIYRNIHFRIYVLAILNMNTIRLRIIKVSNLAFINFFISRCRNATRTYIDLYRIKRLRI